MGTLDIKSDGRIHSTNTGVDLDITNGGTVTVSGSLEVERDVDLISGSITNECSASIDVTTVFNVQQSIFGMDVRSGATYTQRGPLNGAQPATTDPPLHIRAGGIYIDDTASCVVGTPADLSITKSDNVDPVIAGNQLTYTVTVTNNDVTNTATNVVVTDTLPAGVTFVSTNGCTEDPNGVPTCSLGSIAPSTSDQYTVTVTVDADVPDGTVLNNQVSVASDDDPNNGNDSISENTTVNAEADLTITKTDSSDPVLTLSGYVYTITVTNNGPSDAQGVVVTDTLPAGVTFVSTTGCAEDPNGVPTCTLGTIAAGNFVQYTISVTSPATAGLITNNASVASTTTLINTGDDSTSEDTTVNAPPAGLDFGDAPNSYGTLLASNGARHTIGGPFLGPVGPDVEADASPPLDGTGDDTVGVDDEDGISFNPPLTPGVGATVDITASAVGLVNAWIDFDENGDFTGPGEQILTDVAVAAGLNPGIGFAVPPTANAGLDGDTFSRFRIDTGGGLGPTGLAADGEVEDHIAHLTTTDLSLTKMVNDNMPNVGDIITFTLTVNNAGPDAATGVIITDTLDAGLTFNSVTSDTSGGTFDGTTWTLGASVAGSGGSHTLIFTADVNSVDPMFNFAEVTTSPLFDIDSTPNNGASPVPAEDDEAVSALNVQVADLRIEKTVDNTNPAIGDTVTYTVTVTNDGPDTSTGVVYDEEWDSSGMTPIIATATNFIIGPSNCTSPGLPLITNCSIFTTPLIPGDTSVLTFSFLITGSGNFVNTAEITAADQFDPDSTPNNGIIGEDDDASLTITAGSTDSEGSTRYAHPTIALPYVENGFCFDSLCLTVLEGALVTHLDLQTIDSGSTHTISVTVNCPMGFDRCNYIAIGASPPGTDMNSATWKIILQKVGDEWQQTVINDNGEIGEVTSTVQQVNGGRDTQASSTIEFVVPALLGTELLLEEPAEGTQIINVEVRDSRGGYAMYIFNEGFLVDDIFAYPEIATSYETALEYEKLCINEDETDRYTCAFDLVKQWTIQQAEEKLKEMYDYNGNDMDSFDESEQY